MALLRKVISAAPLLLLGCWVFWLLFHDAHEQMSAVAVGCPDSITYSFRCGNEALDNFLCAIVLFFKSALSTNHGLWTSGYLLTLVMSSFAFMAVESSRYGNSRLLSLMPLYAVLFQVCGISVIVPALWLPVYILSNASERSPASVPGKKVSPRRVAFIKCSLLFVEFVSVAMLIPTKNLNKDLIIFSFQFAPIICPVFWLPFTTTEASDSNAGHKAVVLLHALQGGGALVWHLVGVVMLLDDPGITSRLIKLLSDHPGEQWCTFFLFVDAVVLFASFIYMIYLEDGILTALKVLVGTPLIGPGAVLSFYFISREEAISKSSRRLMPKSKKN